MNNWLLVTDVDGSGITVEPPPALDLKQRTYKVYAGEPGKMHLLGPLRGTATETISDEWGAGIYSLHKILTDEYSGTETGQEIAITRLEKGHDTVFVTNYAYSTYNRE